MSRQFVPWFIFMVVLYLAMNVYIWARLVRTTALPAPWSTVVTTALVLVGLGVPFVLIGTRYLNLDLRVLAMPALMWTVMVILLSVLLFATDVARWIAPCVHRIASGAASVRSKALAPRRNRRFSRASR